MGTAARSMTAMSGLLRGAPRSVTIPLVASFLIGCCGLALGAYLDVSGNWPPWPFLVNIASGADSALIGIPLAAIVGQRLIAALNTHMRRRDTLLEAIEGSAQLSRAIRDAYDNDLPSMGDAVIRLTRRIPAVTLNYPSPDLDIIRDYYFNDSEFFHFFRGEGASEHWLRVSAAYLSLREISTRLRNLGGSWISPKDELSMTRAVNPVPEMFLQDPPLDRDELIEWALRICEHTKTVITVNYEIAECLAEQVSGTLPLSLQEQCDHDKPPEPILDTGKFLAYPDPPHRALSELYGEEVDMESDSALMEELRRSAQSDRSED